ncbi:hypothetical protein [Sulfobacillus harzensis]|uniref:Uncharacterized protein n=1 Tax=Sulfobacillus harzensis TaxID=2729629 RepID=A0A7Y0L5M5_9FIRM|nr:hypothetical protein [Sulfobacillus harzensis]NMP23742.1 hypothetical protein [Sulfobacillus harzensis]
MDWDTIDDETLGQAVDAWLTALRAQGLSERRMLQLAVLLGEAMSGAGPKTPAQAEAQEQFLQWLNASGKQ